MYLIIASRVDEASMSMANHLLKTGALDGEGKEPDIRANGKFAFAYIDEKHLFLEDFAKNFATISNMLEGVIFLSKHSSAADIKSITVHPTGNFGEAKLGGRERKLSMSLPDKMSSTLRFMADHYRGTEFSVTFEATHHGPLLDIPNFFMEIGTTKEQWRNEEALDAVVNGILSPVKSTGNSFVGAGGGHYMPKVTRYALENSVDIGHMISKHALEGISRDMIEQSVMKTPGCKGFVIDKKGVKSDAKQIIKEFADDFSLETIYT